MIEKFKEWYYKYGLLAASDEEEAKKAEEAIEEFGAKILDEKSFMYKLIYKIFLGNSIYASFCKKAYIFKAKNRTEAFGITDKYIQLTNGFIINQNINRPVVEEES